MATVTGFYGYDFDPSDLALSDATLVKIVWSAKDAASNCRGLSDFAGAYADLERAALHLLALRALHDQLDLAASGRRGIS